MVMPGSGIPRFHGVGGHSTTPASQGISASIAPQPGSRVYPSGTRAGAPVGGSNSLGSRASTSSFGGPSGLRIDTASAQAEAPTTIFSPTVTQSYERKQSSIGAPSATVRPGGAIGGNYGLEIPRAIQARPRSGHRVKIVATTGSTEPGAPQQQQQQQQQRQQQQQQQQQQQPQQWLYSPQATASHHQPFGQVIQSVSLPSTTAAAQQPQQQPQQQEVHIPAGEGQGGQGSAYSSESTINYAQRPSGTGLRSPTPSSSRNGAELCALSAFAPDNGRTIRTEEPQLQAFPYGHSSNQGLRDTMEDEFIALSLQPVKSALLCSLPPSTDPQSVPFQTISVFAIVDGHGGRAAAQFIRTHLFNCIKYELEHPRPAPPPLPTGNQPNNVSVLQSNATFISPTFSSIPNDRSNPKVYNSSAPINVDSCLRNAFLRLDEAYASFVVNDVYVRSNRRSLAATLEASGRARRIQDEAKAPNFMNVSPSMHFSPLTSGAPGDEMPDTLAGAVLSLAMIHHETGKLYVVHLGDTRCILASRNKPIEDKSSAFVPFMRASSLNSTRKPTEPKKDGPIQWKDIENCTFIADQVTKDHKATNPFESSRVRRVGGKIIMGRVDASLAVTRAIGDLSFKKITVSDVDVQKARDPSLRDFRLPFIYYIHSAVTADPDICSFDLNHDDAFLILGCDGIWDVVSSQRAVELVAEALREDLQQRTQFGETNLPLMPPTGALQAASERVVQAALAGGSTDNVSCLVVWLGSVLDFSRIANAAVPPASQPSLRKPSLQVGLSSSLRPGLTSPGGLQSLSLGVGPLRRPSECGSPRSSQLGVTSPMPMPGGRRRSNGGGESVGATQSGIPSTDTPSHGSLSRTRRGSEDPAPVQADSNPQTKLGQPPRAQSGQASSSTLRNRNIGSTNSTTTTPAAAATATTRKMSAGRSSIARVGAQVTLGATGRRFHR